MSTIASMHALLVTDIVTAVSGLAQQTMGWLRPIFVNLVVIYLALTGYALWAGKIEMPLNELISRLIRIAAVSTFALTWSIYSDHIIDIAFHGPDEVLSGITGSGNDAINALDGLWDRITDTSEEKFDENSGMSISQALEHKILGVMLSITGWLICFPAFLIIVASQLLTALLIVIGPIFIVASLFSKSSRYTEAWVNQLLTYFMLYVLIILVEHLAAEIFEQMHLRLENKAALAQLGFISEMLLVGLIMMGVSLMTPFLAGGLVGVTAPGIQNALRFIPGPGMLRHLKPSTPTPRQGGPGGSGYLKRWGKS